MSEILLVFPSEEGRVFDKMPPLGLAWIASFLESKGFSVDFVDLQVVEKDFNEILKEKKPRVVGISGTSHTRYKSFQMARDAKLYDRDTFVLYGGSHATFTAAATLDNVPEIDVVVKGEGEQSTLQVVEKALKGKYDFDDIEGISFRKDEKIVHNRPITRMQSLEALPFPKRNPQDFKKYNLKMDFINVPGASIMTSRGCPLNCSYCSASFMFGKTLTFRSAKNVVDEIEMLLSDFGVKGIKFFDSTLTLKKSHIEALCEEIKKRRLRFPWECEIRVNTVDKELLRKMKDAGCYYVDFGLESASDRVLKEMHKGIRLEHVENVIRWTNDLGILTKVFFTYGHIKETIEDARMTMEFVKKYKKNITLPVEIIGIRTYPGTLVEKYAREIGNLSDDFSWVKPYYDKEAEFLTGFPGIPLLIQPQMGYKELKTLKLELLGRKIRDPRRLIKALYNAWNKNNIKKVYTTAKGYVKSKTLELLSASEK